MPSLLSFLRAGPPPPKVALLPDALFFTRAVPITAGASAADATAQVELALEAVSPFPLAQLYYGWFWTAGAEHALVFAAYRRRFTSDQIAMWEGSELVLPVFASVAGASVEPATTIILTAPEGLTAVHWEKPSVPSNVIFRPLAPEATDDDRARVRDELLRSVNGSKTVIDLAEPPLADSSASEGEVVFRAGEVTTTLPATTAAALDVRDKGELAALRQARQRDILLWRVTLGCAAALILLGLFELALIGGKQWQVGRQRVVAIQKPVVDKIQAADALARRIDDLATKKLLPFEMITILQGEDGKRKPADIWFNSVRASTSGGIYTVEVSATTNNVGQMSAYKSVLEALPACQSVVLNTPQTRADIATFTLVVTFKPEALKAPSA